MPLPFTPPTLSPIVDALNSGDCLLLVLSKPMRHVAAGFTKVSVRPVVVRKQGAFHFTYHFADKVTHCNLEPAAAAERAVQLLTETFENAALHTSVADISFRVCKDGSFAAKSGPPTRQAEPVEHNRTKSYLIPENSPCPFLAEIGVMNAEGRVRAPMQHKFRQINRFLELANDVVPALPADRELHVVDFGCGKSYLTFALHHLLTVVHDRPARIVGLDRKPDVIRDCAAISRRLGCAGLEFREGKIGDGVGMDAVDLVVALHACDTATDDALAQALAWNAPVILAVPCCQHELAGAMEVPALAPLMRHGILRERFASLATDALRAAILEICGYSTQIVEFIDLEHTAKNLLIRAVRRDRPDDRRAERLREYAAYKKMIGVEQPYLEKILGEVVT